MTIRLTRFSFPLLWGKGRMGGLALAAAVMLAGCKPQADFKVSLRVIDQDTGNPIPNAWVFVLAKAEAKPPREAPYNKAVVAARGKTDSDGRADLEEVQGFYWGEEPNNELWKMLESRTPRVQRMISSIEGGDILVFAEGYGALHQFFGVKRSPQYEAAKKKGLYTGFLGQIGYKGEDSPIELSPKDLGHGRELTLAMKAPDNPEYLLASFSIWGLDATWAAMSQKTGATREQQRLVYEFFINNARKAIHASSETYTTSEEGDIFLQQVRDWYIGAWHDLKQAADHDVSVHLWLTEKALELLPAADSEIKAHAGDIEKGVQDEDLDFLPLKHFYDPDAPETGLWGNETALQWGGIGYAADPGNEWSWPQALYYYDHGDKTKAYQALGHVLHLLQDLSVPTHTHLIAHPPMSGAARFETYFADIVKANNGNLPQEYSQGANGPTPVSNLKVLFDSMAVLTFGKFREGSWIIDFDDYYAQGQLLRAPDDQTLELMGDYLLPQAIENGAGLLAYFYGIEHRASYVQGPADTDTDAAENYPSSPAQVSTATTVRTANANNASMTPSPSSSSSSRRAKSSECDIAFASTQTTDNISLLDNKIDPYSQYRSFHGKQERGTNGQRVYVPDPDTLSDFAHKMNLTESDTELLAKFASERDNMRRLQERMGQEQTQCLYASEGIKSDVRLARVLTSSQKALREDSGTLEKEANEALLTYRELMTQLGKQKAADLFEKIQSTSRSAQNSVLENQRLENEKARSAAKKRCEQGLLDCEFPEGLPANCAPFLEMSTNDILKVCPHPKRMWN